VHVVVDSNGKFQRIPKELLQKLIKVGSAQSAATGK